MRVAYLGPAGTFSEDALRSSGATLDHELAPQATIFDAIDAVESGSAERAFVPFENSIEGTVRVTLDALAFDTSRTRIIGELDHPILQTLIGRRHVPLEEIAVVVSHPQASAQCARFLRQVLPRAEVRTVSSTAEAVRQVSEGDGTWAALGSVAAAEVYGCTILREGVEDAHDNLTRFVWLAREGTVIEAPEGRPWRTTLVFFELGEDHPGALVRALTELSSRAINMTRIESRPRRSGLGRYLFFVDLDGRADDPVVAEGIEALRSQAETVRLLGSYPVGSGPARA